MKKEELIKKFYCIPCCCNMHPYEHFDGAGGCWGISSGRVFEKDYCNSCEYKKPEKKKRREINEPTHKNEKT